jgi:phosphoglycerol transferase MdoB-like AlkP superfamily enzyme|tara:strand:- start:350 stop:2380 length:2031 start_codon:yes stop_codon:yes gene_type:complete
MLKLYKGSMDMHAHFLLWLFLSTLVSAVFLLGLRVVALHYFTSIQSLFFNTDFWQVLLTGMRFDIAIVMRLFLPIYLLSILAIPLPHTIGRAVLRLGHWWGTIIVALLLSLSVANVAYIAFFDEPFSAFAIESLVYYDAEVVFASIMGSGGSLFYAAAFILAPLSMWIMLILSRWQLNLKVFYSPRLLQSLAIVPLSFLLIIALGRGSFGNFPLGDRHLIVSKSQSFNNIVPNGLLSGFFAVSDYINSSELSVANDEEGRAIFEDFYGYSASNGELWPQLFTLTPSSKLLESKPPNVVLNVMESLGTELLRPEFNQPHDWAADFRGHLNDDLFMPRFLPAHNSSQSSLIELVGNINYPTVTQSKYQNIPLMTAAAKVFKRAGYKTLFVYTGFEGERNLSKYVKTQGFDEFVGASRLQEIYAQMETNVWGGEDRYMFEYITEQLRNKTADGPPLFIMTMSINNHPPYVALKDMTSAHLDLTPLVKDKLANLPEISMSTYEYGNRYLGRFISQIKTSQRMNDTIIAVTGDHGTRGLKDFSGSALRNNSVPFYLYIPPVYTPWHELDLLQLASHKDIFPTLYHLSLSGASYPNLGRNLFQPATVDDVHNFAMYYHYLVTQDGAVLKANPGVIYPFVSSDDLQLRDAIPYNQKKSVNRGKAYSALMDWMMRKQLAGRLTP